MKKCFYCGYEGEFLPYGIPERKGKCPECGTKPRHRFNYYFLKELVPKYLGNNPKNVLEIGPSKPGTKTLPYAHEEMKYTAIDIRELSHHKKLKTPHQFFSMDATSMSFEQNSFDVVFANNVLEFIPDYEKVLDEIYRVLSPRGVFMSTIGIDDRPQTKSAEDFQKANPELVTEEFLVENGSAWYFGLDALEKWKQHHWCPLYGKINEYFSENEGSEFGFKTGDDFLFSFKEEENKQEFIEVLKVRP